MNLPELSIKRHVLAWMMSGLFVLFGIVSAERIGVDRFPAVDFPMISVSTVQVGAGPEVIDASITSIVEDKINSIPGIERVHSFSTPNLSVVTVEFLLSKNIDVAFNEVQTKINQILRELPEGSDPPIIAKLELGAAPIMWLALTGDRTPQQLDLYARNTIKKRIENIEGLGEVLIGGARKRTVRIWLDMERMQGLAVTIPEVIGAFQKEHLQFPGGFLTGDKHEYLINLDMEFHTVDALKKMIVRSIGGSTITLNDIARIEDGLADNRQLARHMGKEAIALGIVKVPGANVVAIADELQRRLDKDILPALPPGLNLSITSSEAEITRSLVDGLKEHLVESILLTFLVVFLFLKNIRATLIVTTVIPVSLFGAITVAYFFGFTLNLMTLLSLLLLIGIVVDDAIVVLENIYRHRDEGLEPDARSAALSGSKEVTFSVVAASLSLIAIFAPVIFMEGMIGRMFSAFAIIVSMGVLGSLFVSLTLIPMLCSRYLHVEQQHGRIYQLFDRAFLALDNSYKFTLDLCLRHRWRVLLSALTLFLASLSLFGMVGKDFIPNNDTGDLLVGYKTPLGSTLGESGARLDELEAILSEDPDIESYFTMIGVGAVGQVSEGRAFVTLKNKEKRKRSQQDVRLDLQKQLGHIPGLQAFITNPSPIGGGSRGESLQLSLTGPDINIVAELARDLMQKLEVIPGIGNPDLDMQMELPQLKIHVDRQRASDLGISAMDVAYAIGVLTGGIDVANFNEKPGDGNRYDIRLQAEPGQLKHSTDLGKIYLRTASGEQVRLDTIANWQPELAPAKIQKVDMLYSAMFFSEPTVPMGEIVAQIKKLATVSLPQGYSLSFIGQAEHMGKSFQSLVGVFAMAIILIYMVLASQFDSFVQPWVLMLAQPMAIVGGVAALVLSGNTLNIFSMMGLVLLVGLVAKNSILLVDLTNQYRQQGLSIDQALRQACPTRMRPVLMTSMTIIFAMLPAATGFGSASDWTIPMAVTVIGGMISSTLLTLVVVPAAYSLLEHGIESFHQRRAARQKPIQDVNV